MSEQTRFQVGDIVRVIAGPHVGIACRVQISWGSSVCLEIDGALVWFLDRDVERVEEEVQ